MPKRRSRASHAPAAAVRAQSTSQPPRGRATCGAGAPQKRDASGILRPSHQSCFARYENVCSSTLRVSSMNLSSRRRSMANHSRLETRVRPCAGRCAALHAPESHHARAEVSQRHLVAVRREFAETAATMRAKRLRNTPAARMRPAPTPFARPLPPGVTAQRRRHAATRRARAWTSGLSACHSA